MFYENDTFSRKYSFTLKCKNCISTKIGFKNQFLDSKNCIISKTSVKNRRIFQENDKNVKNMLQMLLSIYYYFVVLNKQRKKQNNKYK